MERFPYYWPFVWGIQRSPAVPPQRASNVDVFFDVSLHNLANIFCRLFEMSWHLCDVTVMKSCARIDEWLAICINTLRPRRNRRHLADEIFKCIFFNENLLISIKISLKFIPKGPINKIPTLVQIMASRRPGDKPLSEPMMIISLTLGLNELMSLFQHSLLSIDRSPLLHDSAYNTAMRNVEYMPDFELTIGTP